MCCNLSVINTSIINKQCNLVQPVRQMHRPIRDICTGPFTPSFMTKTVTRFYIWGVSGGQHSTSRRAEGAEVLEEGWRAPSALPTTWRVRGSAVSSPSGVREKPRPKTILANSQACRRQLEAIFVTRTVLVWQNDLIYCPGSLHFCAPNLCLKFQGCSSTQNTARLVTALFMTQ